MLSEKPEKEVVLDGFVGLLWFWGLRATVGSAAVGDVPMDDNTSIAWIECEGSCNTLIQLGKGIPKNLFL